MKLWMGCIYIKLHGERYFEPYKFTAAHIYMKLKCNLQNFSKLVIQTIGTRYLLLRYFNFLF